MTTAMIIDHDQREYLPSPPQLGQVGISGDCGSGCSANCLAACSDDLCPPGQTSSCLFKSSQLLDVQPLLAGPAARRPPHPRVGELLRMLLRSSSHSYFLIQFDSGIHLCGM